MAQLITAGHIYAHNYRWHFFVTALKSLAEARKQNMIDIAIGTRAAKMDTVDFNKFIEAKPMSHDEIYEKHQAGEL